MLISFSGLDGAGKSTLIAWTRAHLEQRGVRATVFHMNDHVGLYAYARMLRDTVLRARRTAGARNVANRTAANGVPATADAAPVDSGHVAPTRNWRSAAKRIQDAVVWNTTVRSVLYPLDLLIFLLYRTWVECVRRQVLIMDRYFYDTLVDLSVGRPAGAVRLLQWITPTPALAVLLDVSPEESFARKGEYSVPYLRRRHVAYHDVMQRVSSILLVRNDELRPTQRVLTEALAICTGGAGAAAPAARPRATGAASPRQRTDTALATEGLAAFTLRALLDNVASHTPAPAEWPVLSALAARNGVLLRLHRCIEQANSSMPSGFTLAVAAERARADTVLASIGTLERALSEAGIPVVFPKAFMHSPDVGSDIDLLVSARHGAAVAGVLMDVLGAEAHPIRLQQRMAGCATFQIPGCRVAVDVHSGRLGPAGEHDSYAEYLLRHAVEARGECAIACQTARLEDQLVLQGQERVYGRRALRLADLVFTIRLLRGTELDWDYVLATTRRTAALGGLSCYLTYVEQICGRLLGAELLPPHVRAALPLSGWGGVAFRGGQFAFPAVRVGARITMEKFAGAVRARSWRSAARVCLLPLITLGSAPVRFRGAGQPALALNTVPRFRE